MPTDLCVDYQLVAVLYGKDMADKQLNVKPAEKGAVEAYSKRRAALREEYIKQMTNPHRHGTGEGGM
ncbi:hypothetical protein L798_04749 [Zootermopsis nevadensis]|uniref:Uncharacterized protein n=1 Tax=Zootermopsis nevadensis TaxID=136037 RepID=A0A067QHP1_ZOONE|nr:hypothetical protein L798_04749 [Zootermopsis nevadensis]